MKRRPIFTLCVCAAALLVWLVPGAAERWVYDRQAILRGEIWRLFTGHFVHFSWSHLGLDVATLALVGSLLESRTHAPRAALFLGVPCVISFALLVFEPAMARYGGLSGLATAATVLVALNLREGQPKARQWGGIVVAGLLLKTAYEWFNPSPLFAVLPTSAIITAPASHIVGASLAPLLFVLQKWFDRPTRWPADQKSASRQCSG